MKPETARDLLIPYIDGELDPQTAALLEKHLASDPDMGRELEQLRVLLGRIAEAETLQPDPEMRRRFDALLAAGKQEAAGHPVARPRRASWALIPFPSLLRAAAALALLAGGTGAGWWLARTGSPSAGETGATTAEVEKLRRDVELLRGLVSRAPLAAGSASFRLQTMSFARELTSPEPDVMDALFITLKDDESANVRLAALEAIARFKEEPDIRRRLAAALPEQNDPFVQIALIGVLTQTGAAEVRAPIEQLLLRPDVPAVVKGFAQENLTRL
jgi:hypothetical protein